MENGLYLFDVKAEKIEIVQPGEEKLWADLSVTFQDLKGGDRKGSQEFISSTHPKNPLGVPGVAMSKTAGNGTWGVLVLG